MPPTTHDVTGLDQGSPAILVACPHKKHIIHDTSRLAHGLINCRVFSLSFLFLSLSHHLETRLGDGRVAPDAHLAPARRHLLDSERHAQHVHHRAHLPAVPPAGGRQVLHAQLYAVHLGVEDAHDSNGGPPRRGRRARRTRRERGKSPRREALRRNTIVALRLVHPINYPMSDEAGAVGCGFASIFLRSCVLEAVYHVADGK